MLQRILLPLLILTFSSAFTFTTSSFNDNYHRYSDRINDASAWVTSHCITKKGELLVTPEELTITLNLLYFSYQRSASTLRAQKNSIQFLNHCWQSWQNIIQRRRNPSKAAPFPRAYVGLEKQAAEFARLVQEHELHSSIYDRAAELVFKEHLITNPHLFTALNQVKESARSVVTKALISVNEYIEQLTDDFVINRCTLFPEEDEADQEITRSGLFTYLQENLPLFGMVSYAKADNLFITASHKQWSALYHAQKISAIIWNTIEKERAHFYYIYYRTLYQHAQEIGIDQISCIFDYTGMLPVEHQKELLPSPETFSLF